MTNSNDHRNSRRATARRHRGIQAGAAGALFVTAALASGVATAGVGPTFEQIDEGFQLFTEETFGGNGRTCSTCHIPEVNYNIFPDTIKKMSKAERDLGWKPETTFEQLVHMMVDADVDLLSGKLDALR